MFERLLPQRLFQRQAPQAPKPPTQQETETIYTDNPLPAVYGQAYLTAKYAEDTIILPPVSDFQDVKQLLVSLVQLKEKGGIQEMSQNAPIFQALLKANYINAEGQATNKFKQQLQAKLKVILIYQVSEEQYPAIVFSPGGMAYIDSAGAACPSDSDSKEPQKNFPNVLRGFWAQFYGLTEAQAQQRAPQDCRFHENIKQQQEGDKHDSIAWCVTNVESLHKNIAATPEDLKKATKIDGKQIVNTINGKPDPRKKGAIFNLVYKNESKDEEKRQAWRTRFGTIQKNHQFLLESAQAEKKKADDAGANGAPELSKSAKVTLARQVKYSETKELNVYTTTTDSDGVTNKIEDKANAVIGESSGGLVTYYERFLKLAQDMKAALVGADGHVDLPVVINSVEPPEQRAECEKAFKDFFGATNVQLREAEKVEENESTVTGCRPNVL